MLHNCSIFGDLQFNLIAPYGAGQCWAFTAVVARVQPCYYRQRRCKMSTQIKLRSIFGPQSMAFMGTCCVAAVCVCTVGSPTGPGAGESQA